MPDTHAINELVLDVMRDHGIGVQDLARLTGCSHSYVSRVADRQYAVPPAITRELWRRTRDHRIAEACLGPGAFEIVPVADDAGLPDNVACAMGVRAVARVNHLIAEPSTLRSPARRDRELVAGIDEAVRHLLSIKRRLLTPAPTLDRSV